MLVNLERICMYLSLRDFSLTEAGISVWNQSNESRTVGYRTSINHIFFSNIIYRIIIVIAFPDSCSGIRPVNPDFWGATTVAIREIFSSLLHVNLTDMEKPWSRIILALVKHDNEIIIEIINELYF